MPRRFNNPCNCRRSNGNPGLPDKPVHDIGVVLYRSVRPKPLPTALGGRVRVEVPSQPRVGCVRSIHSDAIHHVVLPVEVVVVDTIFSSSSTRLSMTSTLPPSLFSET